MEREHDPEGVELATEVARRVAGVSRQASPGAARPRRRRQGWGEEVRSGAHPDDRDPQLIGSLVKQVAAERGWRPRLSLSNVLKDWPRLVGESNAAHAHPISYEEGVLIVQCDSTAWASAMKYSAGQLVARLNDALGQQSVKRIEFQGPDAPNWRRGRRYIRGRGPRDTYG